MSIFVSTSDSLRLRLANGKPALARWVGEVETEVGQRKKGGFMDHSECIKKLQEIGNRLGFHSVRRSYGKMYHMGNPDCVWYYKGPGQEVLAKIAKGDRYKYIPLVAFEVAFSEKEKNLRGTLVTLQLTNASASIVVLLGESAKYRSYMKKLVGRYSFARFRIWTERDVDAIYSKVFKSKAGKDDQLDSVDAIGVAP